MIRCIAFLVLITAAAAVQANISKHALVVGNSSYAMGELNNPRNDAEDMAGALGDLGFTIHSGGALFDLTKSQFDSAISAFSASLPRKAMAVVYFAGHGMTWGRDNYLIPVGARLSTAERLDSEAISLRETVKRLFVRNPNGINIFLLDACRDNPLVQQAGVNRDGLVRIVNIPHGTFIGYAAEEGQLASDGDGRNGLYTSELLNALRDIPGEPILALHNRVRQGVLRRSRLNGEPQFPVMEESLIGEYCFGSCGVSGRVLPRALEQPVKPISVPAASQHLADSKNKWWYVILGAVAVAVLTSAGGGSQGMGNSDSTDTIQLNLSPPAR